MNTRVWKYRRVSRDKVEDRAEAIRIVGPKYKFHTTTTGQYVFRRRLIPNGEKA